MRQFGSSLIFAITAAGAVFFGNCTGEKKAKTSIPAPLIQSLLNSGNENEMLSTADSSFDRSFSNTADNSPVKSMLLKDMNSLSKETASGTKTVSETVACAAGGKAVHTGSYDLTVNSITDQFNRDLSIQNFTMTVTFDSCSFHEGMKLVSGSVTQKQTGTMKVVMQKTDSTVNISVSGRTMEVTGTEKAERNGGMRPAVSITMTRDIRESFELNRMKFTVNSSSELTDPVPLYIKGSVIGKVSVDTPRGKRERDISRTFEKTF
ncbi:MAG TPA: hypothetical protein PK453_18050 [Leptospiraceae bacterium]|nr:hypothetical protein [Leptospiraceae bacterium]HNF15573.1 hypothetical protein [Leptospiraceae bacterium]HNF24484.1 hypothetical protein [Leptospiraceae bacterium]HNN02564.1 hypothetical protein [Leptospiraceae bacterium]